MKAIQNNPYRIAGTLSNATERELQKQKGKISRYASIGKNIDSDVDFDFLESIERSEDQIKQAFSNIEQNPDKVINSLFWFLNLNMFDNTAIKYLAMGDKEKAIDIWEKVTKEKEVTSKNYSSFNNIGTIKLLSSFKSNIKAGIEAKIKLINSPFLKDFIHVVADETYSIDKEKLTEKFITELLEQFEDQFSPAETVELFSNCNGTTQKYLSQKLTEQPIHNIERQIEISKNKRRENKRDAYNFGLNLFTSSKGNLSLLRSLLGRSELKYKIIADNLAKEIMQCGIDYFQEWKDAKDPSEEGLKLLKYAQSVAEGIQTKDRITENIEGIQEWATTAPIKADLEFITKKLNTFNRQFPSIENAKSLVNNCKRKLQNIKSVLGPADEFYLTISSAIASNAMGMVIEVVNEAQSGLEYDRSKVLLLPDIVSEAVSAFNAIGWLDMEPQVRRRFTENKSSINSMNGQLERVRRQLQSGRSSSRSGGACYVATMAYGDYDHPQVIKLRRFRDEILSGSYLGRAFIKVYYKYSPSLVESLKNKKKINRIIRQILDQFIKITLK